MNYLWHERFGNQIGFFSLFGPVEVLVGSSNIHVSTNVICSKDENGNFQAF